MSISLDKFVNVNLVHHETSVNSTTRDTVVLLSGIGFDDEGVADNKYKINRAFNDDDNLIFTTLPDYPDVNQNNAAYTLTKYYDKDIYGEGTAANPWQLPFPYSFFYYIEAVDTNAETITLHVIEQLIPIYQYLKVFFDNKGVKAKLQHITVKGTDMSAVVDNYYETIVALKDEYILVAIVNDTIESTQSTTNSDGTEKKIVYKKSLPLDYLNKLAKKLDSVYYGTDLTTAKGTLINVSSDKVKSGIHRKLLIGRIRYTDIYDKSAEVLQNKYSSKSLILKYSSCKNVYDDDLNVLNQVDKIGDEMSIAAYLTRINIDSSDSVKDYCYTIESCYPDVTCKNSHNSDAAHDSNGYESKEVDDDLYDKLNACHFTFTYNLANQNRAIGGDTCAGYSFVNEYVAIIVQQTITDNLIKLLVTKPKTTNICGMINSVISSDLNRYVTNGYLATNKCWTDEDLSVTRNGVTYDIISTGTQLSSGYYITVLPLSSLTATEKKNHAAPKAYVILAESDAIRTIDVSGEII